MAENEMKAMYGLPVEVRSTAQLGFFRVAQQVAHSLERLLLRGFMDVSFPASTLRRIAKEVELFVVQTFDAYGGRSSVIVLAISVAIPCVAEAAPLLDGDKRLKCNNCCGVPLIVGDTQKTREIKVTKPVIFDGGDVGREDSSEFVGGGHKCTAVVFSPGESVSEVGDKKRAGGSKADLLVLDDSWVWYIYPTAVCWLAGCFRFGRGWHGRRSKKSNV